MKEKLAHTLFKKHFTVPKTETAERVIRTFSLTEKCLFYACALVLVISAGAALLQVNRAFMVEVPARGGTLTEGVVSLPRFINPILAISDADRDLTALMYSGLLKATPSGELAPDLAESYSISGDGLTYTFILKPTAMFQDKVLVTADDVVFTIQKAQDPAVKSPKRPNWEGVTVEKINDRTVALTLKQPYSPFLENATLGIIPKHIWGSLSAEEFPFSEFNIEPIGSGPYKLKSMERSPAGIPVYYRLEAFDRYISGTPYIKNLIVRFFSNTNDLIAGYENGIIQSMAGISPQQAKVLQAKGSEIERTPLPRIFAAFFNQNHAPLLLNKEVRQALETATDKQAIVDSVLSGEGIAIEGPIPPGLLSSDSGDKREMYASEEERVDAARKILEKASWKFNSEKGVYQKTVKKETIDLAFSISTSNAPELKAAAEMLKTMWEKIGAKVDVKIFDIGELNQNVIRTRKYDILLFGEIIGRDLDLFAFWHSSQRNDPGLNVALYTNAKADKLLEEARASSDRVTRLEKYKLFEKEVFNDIPAVFMYSPDFLYVVPEKLRGVALGHITVPAERFLNVAEWYVETEHVWKIFAPEQSENNN